MAFTTEFVMGAGGAEFEEIPVAMSGSGAGTVYPLATVDAGTGALILVTGTIDPASTTTSGRPHLTIGPYTNISPHEALTGSGSFGIGGRFSGTVQVSILSRYHSVTTFSGKVYVVRM